MSKMSEIHMMIHDAVMQGADVNDIIIELVNDYNIDRVFARRLVVEIEEQYYEEMENNYER